MGKLEEMFRDWADDQEDSQEVKEAYEKMGDDLVKEIGMEKFNAIDDLFMRIVMMEKMAAFKGGFRQATALWKEVG